VGTYDVETEMAEQRLGVCSAL